MRATDEAGTNKLAPERRTGDTSGNTPPASRLVALLAPSLIGIVRVFGSTHNETACRPRAQDFLYLFPQGGSRPDWHLSAYPLFCGSRHLFEVVVVVVTKP